MSAMAQRSYTFNAAALNVDGLPEKIMGITINEGAPGAAGATMLSNHIANSGWAFCGFSEDFNYHSELTAAPASNYYNFGVHGGSVSGLSNSTDGLGFACSKFFTMEGGTRVAWGTHYGETSDGADGLISKGFRVYTVTLATGVAVDVYVLHMDASDGTEDIKARESQLTQLATYIMNNHNGRPVIVLGDTNCRYTREQLETMFIDVINADSRFTIKDAWVEHMWGGTYPTYGSDAMMTHAYGDQKGEVVDKVFYINTTESNLTLKANSYLHDTSITISDHYPVVVNFTLTDPNGTPLTDAEKENNWTLEESVVGNKKPTWEGEQVVSNTPYYLMNVGTGEYIKWGGAYYTEAVGGNGGTPITPITSDGGATWVLKTSRNHVGDGDYTYLDQTGTWYLEPVDGTAYQYRIRSTRNLYLTANTTEAHHPIKSEAGNANDDKQKWVFLTDDRIRTEMTKATGEYPFNFTALLKSADFDVIEFEDGWTDNWTGFTQASGPFMGVGAGWGGDASQYVTYAYANSTNETTMSQDLGTLPNGTYNISFEGFYRSRKKSLFSTSDETRNAVVAFGSTNIAILQNKSTAVGAGADVVGPLFKNDAYFTSQEVNLASSANVTLKVTKPATSNTKVEAWICVDNFRLMYYGTGEVAIDPNKEYKEQVLAKVNETYPKVMELNEAGQAAYDIATVISRYNNDQITSAAEAKALCSVVDAAYANALAAHNAYNVQQVIDNMNANGGDITGAIINPSFEEGNLNGWNVAGGGWDVKVYPNSDAVFTTTDCDGEYLFNSYGGDNDHTAHIKQTINGIPNGLYELKVKVTSFEDRYVYITGNGYHARVATSQGKGMFHEATLYFLVENGAATIGAVGGNKGGGSTFIHYWPDQGCFFKADDFRLKYICDLPHGRLKLALDEAATANLDEYGKAAFNISEYQEMYENKSLYSDGKAEVTAIHNALQVAAKAQRTINADMTWAITNHSFETGDYTGWETILGWDTGVKPQENGTYTTAGTDGRYLFNTWNNDGNATNTGVNAAITQTVTGIPNGTYRLSAMVASDNENSVMLTGNGMTTTISASTNGAGSGVFPSVECVVTDGKLSIEVKGANDCWFKCDDFHLTLVAPIAVENVTLDKESATLIEGETLTLTAVASPDHATDKTITWNTSDDKVATVDENGHVTAVAPGTATITATSGDKSASCVVTVEAASYVFTLKVEDQVYFTQTVKRGTDLSTLMEEHEVVIPTKEGYTFSGWELPEMMPANDLTLNGTFTINKYTVTFKIGEEIISSEELEYGAAIVAPEAPEKEGYTFDGWGEVAETLPAENVTYEGTYTVNKYTVTFKIGEEIISSEELEYGAAIVAPEAPEKEGYTFDGWGEVAETVPAENVTYEGTYTVNLYKVYYYVGEELVYTDEVAYGEAIPEYTYEPTTEGDVFEGWSGETYETMPAHDIVYTANITNGIGHSSIDAKSTFIYDLSGRRVERVVKGIYIINGKKVFLK